MTAVGGSVEESRRTFRETDVYGCNGGFVIEPAF
jgi:hypothetical protein